ncbi:MAG: NAD-dependent epimerase/dehydratase family protein [Planctomycetes bacterium]|nr:NAD-dependent epimerase/dehydratase family protein [Planctomycetota bacterium]
MNRRVVITGVAGFIGSNLADCLLGRGYEIVGVDDLSQGVREQVPEGVVFHELDVCSPSFADVLCPGDVIFHLAAKNCISDCQQEPVATATTNVVGTVNVLESARRIGARKVVYAESSALYEGVDRFPTPEDELRPESFYALSKYAAMVFADGFRRFHQMSLTALRYFCVYGPRQDYRRTVPPVMSAFIIKLLRGERPVIYGTGEKRRDFVHVDDVNRFHLKCIEDPQTDGRTFNLGSGRNYSVNEVLEIIQRILDVRISPEYRPDLPGEAQQTLADISRARSIGWRPQVSIEDGLRGMVDYYRETRIPWKLA